MTTRPGSLARSGAVLAVATTVANALGYLLVLVLARALSPGELGAAGALLNLAIIGMVPGLALQLLVARAVAAPGTRRPPAVGDALRAGTATGLVLALVVAAASPALAAFLRLGSAWPAVLAGAWLVPATAAFAVQGALQGRERFGALAVSLVAVAAARPVAAVLCVVTRTGAPGLFGGLTLLTALAAAFTVRAALRAQGPAPDDAAPDDAAGTRGAGHPWSGALALVRPLVTATVTTAGFLTLANADVLLARHVLPPAGSGAYAVGALFAKAALWGPQFVSTLVFPRMARTGRERALAGSLAACLATGVVAVAGCALLGGPLVAVVAGDRYGSLARTLWVFAALGGALALVQVLLWARLAVEDHLTGAVAWVCTAGFALAVLADPTPTVAGVAARGLAATAVLVAAGLAVEGYALRRSAGRVDAAEVTPGS